METSSPLKRTERFFVEKRPASRHPDICEFFPKPRIIAVSPIEEEAMLERIWFQYSQALRAHTMEVVHSLRLNGPEAPAELEIERLNVLPHELSLSSLQVVLQNVDQATRFIALAPVPSSSAVNMSIVSPRDNSSDSWNTGLIQNPAHILWANSLKSLYFLLQHRLIQWRSEMWLEKSLIQRNIHTRDYCSSTMLFRDTKFDRRLA